MAIDFSILPLPEIIEELDYESILQLIIADLIARDPAYETILESDPGIKILEVAAARELILRQRINDALKATLLRFTGGGDMDNLAAFYNVTRFDGETDEAFRLRIILRIEGSSAAGGAAWYRYHALSCDPLVKDANVASPGPGEVAVTILSHEGSQLPAATGTDLDQLGEAFGVSRESGESDDDYRSRVLALVLAGGGYGIASPELIATADAYLQADDVRPVTDTLTVSGASILPVDVTADIWLYPQTRISVFESLPAQLQSAFDAQSGMGWDVTQSWIIAQLNTAGVQRVEMSLPAADVICRPNEAPALRTITLVYAGRNI